LNTVARFNLGLALMELGKYDQGLNELREVLRLHPRDALTRKIDEAVASFREGLRYKQDDAEAHYGLGSALSAQHKRDDAVAELREALRLRPDYPEAQQLLHQLAP
jgi:tetratricopeptide (TPR) repeat protein